jgi:hypothetical protein
MVDSALSDGRKCTDCTCAPVPVSCDGGIANFSQGCSTGNTAGDAVDLPTKGCTMVDAGLITASLDGGVNVGPLSGTLAQPPVPSDPTAGSCASDGGIATGEVAPTTVTLICCM